MALRKWAVTTLFGTGLGLAGITAPALLAPNAALAQTAPSLALVIISPAAGASVPSPVTVTISLVHPGAAPGGTAPAMPAHPHGGQAYLIVDAPAPAAGTVITADANHIAFPVGQHQLSVTLSAGPHQLLVVATHKGKVVSRVQPSPPITVTVQ